MRDRRMLAASAMKISFVGTGGCCRVGRLRRSARIRRRADDVDHISALPEDLLLQILARLGCARAAANTSLLSRRWRGLWTRTPELRFHDIAPGRLHAALARLARPAGSLQISVPDHHRLRPACISALLRAAATLAPAKLSVNIEADRSSGGGALAVMLPCLDRTSSMQLAFDMPLKLPPAGDFTSLESVSITCCVDEHGGLLSRCPHLRKLQIPYCWSDSIKVHSPLLEELDVRIIMPLWRIDIATPVLKKLRFSFNRVLSSGFSLSFSAPLVEDLDWRYSCRSASDRFGVTWHIWNLILKTPEHIGHNHLTDNRETRCLQPQRCPRGGNILILAISPGSSSDVNWSFGKEVSQIPVKNFSTLELDITTAGHVYGALVLGILGFCTNIQALKLILNQHSVRDECSINCPCDQPNNWRSKSISLTDLKEVEISGIKGEEHEVVLLKLILGYAAMLENVTMYMSRNVPRGCSAYVELPSILKEHPSVAFNIYSWCGDQVLFG